MSALRKAYRISGLRLERLLESLRGQGIELYDIKRQNARSMQLSCAAAQGKQLEAMAGMLGFSVDPLPPQGWLLRLVRLRRKGIFLGCAGVAAVLLLLSLQFIWHIKITGAGVYRGEVLSFLREKQIGVGCLRRDLDLQALCNELLYRLPRVAWVRAKTTGVTLHVDITQGVPMPAVEPYGGPGDIVAARDGVIERIDVYEGKAAAKAGDTVRAGDVLIRGLENSAGRGAAREVRARGHVYARTWVQAQAVASLCETLSIPTGRSSLVRRFCFLSARVPLDNEPEYLTDDVEIKRVPLGGCWFPLWYEEALHIESALEKTLRSRGEACAQAGEAAMRRLILMCGGSDEMIDKFLDYSMIDGETVLVTATAELRQDIGRYVSKSTD